MKELSAIDIIASHISDELIQKYVKPCNSVCCFTGKEITKGISVKDAISKTFTDQAFMKYKSEYISIEVAKCLMPVLPMQKDISVYEDENGNPIKVAEEDKVWKEYVNALRNYSFIATEKDFRIIESKTELVTLMKNLSSEPFVLCVSYSRKKHIAFKAHLNYSNEKFYIDTDTGSFFTTQKELFLLLSIAEKWYSIVPNPSKELPTFFTKDEIGGTVNLALHKPAIYIAEFGIEVFESEYATLRKYHNTALLNFITFIIQKNV